MLWPLREITKPSRLVAFILSSSKLATLPAAESHLAPIVVGFHPVDAKDARNRLVKHLHTLVIAGRPDSPAGFGYFVPHLFEN